MLNQTSGASRRIQDALPDFEPPRTPARRRRHDCIQVIFDCWQQQMDAVETVRTLKERGFKTNMVGGAWRRTAIYTWFSYFRRHDAKGPIPMRREGKNAAEPVKPVDTKSIDADGLVDLVLESHVSDARAREIIRAIRAGHIKAVSQQLCTMDESNILLARRDIFANEDKPEVMLDVEQAKAVLEGIEHIRAFVAQHK